MSADALRGLTIDAARRALTQRFRASQLDSPELDARVLTGFATGYDLTGLALHGAKSLTTDQSTALHAFAERRLRGEPVARILGTKEFWGLDFTLAPATLVPRPDTETVVQTSLDLLGVMCVTAPRIADIGTGSGAILLALLSERGDATGIGTDLSAEALATAQANADRLGLAGRARFMLCNYADGLSPGFDLVVSNPPYIASAEIEALAIDVRAYDPRLALDGGADGLTAYRALAPELHRLLRQGGAFALEVGHDQADAVAALMVAAGLQVNQPYPTDLAGVPRVVCGQKPAE